MNRILTLGVLLIAGATVFYYFTSSDMKSKIDRWIGISQVDPGQETPHADTLSNEIQPAKSRTKRKKIHKVIKPDKFAYLDKYARETPEKYATDIAKLAGYLKKPAKNDLDKARLVFSWIAAHIRYDDDSFNSGHYKSTSADSVLARRTAVCDGFSSLYLKLGLTMGLEVEKITGYAKGYGYKPGDKFSTTDHAWNAVKIDDAWQLIDVTWASGSGETTDKGLKSTMKFDPYWFCVTPEEFIFSHLPENKEWQLTGSVITLQQYEELPFANKYFFRMGLGSGEVFKKAISGETGELAETFSFEYPVKGVDVPITKMLVRGKAYNFSFESEYLEDIAIIDGDQWIHLKKDGNTFKIEHTPKDDKLEIAAKVNWFDEKFSTIVIYEVVDKKSLAIHNTTPPLLGVL